MIYENNKRATQGIVTFNAENGPEESKLETREVAEQNPDNHPDVTPKNSPEIYRLDILDDDESATIDAITIVPESAKKLESADAPIERSKP